MATAVIYPSARALTWAWDQQGLTIGEKLVLLALSGYVNSEFTCWPSQATLSRQIGMARPSISRAIRGLTDKGLITTTRSGRRNGAMVYTLNVLDVTDGDSRNVPEPPTADAGCNEGSHRLSPSVTSVVTDGDTEPIIEGFKEVNPGGAAKRPRKRDLLFEAICEAVGLDLNNLTGTERGRVNKATKELREVSATPEELIARASRYRKLYPDAALTPQALTGNWGKLVDPDRVPKLPKRLCGCGAEITGTHKPETCIFGGDDP